jgi:hypothetical protein
MKPRAYFYTEGEGMWVFGCKTAEEALEAMRKEYLEADEQPGFVEEYYGFGIERITLENVKKDRIYYHRICSYYTVGENWCGDCGEQTKGNGREAFILAL